MGYYQDIKSMTDKKLFKEFRKVRQELTALAKKKLLGDEYSLQEFRQTKKKIAVIKTRLAQLRNLSKTSQ